MDSSAGEILKNLLFALPGSPVVKESTCKAGDPGLIPGSGRSPRERKGYSLQHSSASLMVQLVKNLPALRPGSIPGLGRSPGEGKGYPLQYSGLKNSRRVGHD